MDPDPDIISKYFTSKWRPPIKRPRSPQDTYAKTTFLDCSNNNRSDKPAIAGSPSQVLTSEVAGCPSGQERRDFSFDVSCHEYAAPGPGFLYEDVVADPRLSASVTENAPPLLLPTLSRSDEEDISLASDFTGSRIEMEGQLASVAIDKLLTLTAVHSGIEGKHYDRSQEIENLREMLDNKRKELREAQQVYENITSEENLVIKEIVVLERKVKEIVSVKHALLTQEVNLLTESIEDMKEVAMVEQRKEEEEARQYKIQDTKMITFEKELLSKIRCQPLHPGQRLAALEQEVIDLQSKVKSYRVRNKLYAGDRADTEVTRKKEKERSELLKIKRNALLQESDQLSKAIETHRAELNRIRQEMKITMNRNSAISRRKERQKLEALLQSTSHL